MHNQCSLECNQLVIDVRFKNDSSANIYSRTKEKIPKATENAKPSVTFFGVRGIAKPIGGSFINI